MKKISNFKISREAGSRSTGQISNLKDQYGYLNLKNFLHPKPYTLYPNLGFTLIELLVVISILVILITLGLTSFTTVQKKGRDAKRKSDIKDMQIALEQYYSVCGYQYPTPIGTTYSPIICTSPSIAIMPTVPLDPKATPYYCGIDPTPQASYCTSSSFSICALLEAETPNTFCLKNQQ